jgi:hypothetical protein
VVVLVPGISLYGLRKLFKNPSQNIQSPGLDLNPGPPEYKAGILSISDREASITATVYRSRGVIEHMPLEQETQMITVQIISSVQTFAVLA